MLPEYSRRTVDRAGQTLASKWMGHDMARSEGQQALTVLNNWRAAHSFPLNTLQMGLRGRARGIEPDAIVSQRLKRTPATIAKLRRFSGMKLSKMQDIAGCRAIVTDPAAVRRLRRAHQESRMKHKLIREDDYVAIPKVSGYRGVHLVYRYRSDRSNTYNGLKVEVQLRSYYQHAWATAVETAGALKGQALKSSDGDRAWLRFFALAGSWFALIEDCPAVPGTPSDLETLRTEVTRLAAELNVVQTLADYRKIIDRVPTILNSNHYYCLLERRPDEKKIYVRGFRKPDLAKATAYYEEREGVVSGIDGAEVVLVAMDSINFLRKAYPSYWLDTDLFIKRLDLAG